MAQGQLDIHLETNKWWTFCLIPSTKFSSNRIADLDVKGKKMKAFRRKLRSMCQDLGTGKDFVKEYPIPWDTKEIKGKLGYIKIKNYIHQKTPFIGRKRQVME